MIASACLALFCCVVPLSTIQAQTNPEKQLYTNQCVSGSTLKKNLANFSNFWIQGWAAEAAIQAYSLDFMNMKNQLQQLSNFFTPKAWKSFQTAFDNSGNMTLIQTKKLAASAVPTGSVIIQDQGVKNGIYTWQVAIPMKITYANVNSLLNQDITLTMLIIRTNGFIGRQGLAIAQFNAVPTPEQKTKTPK